MSPTMTPKMKPAANPDGPTAFAHLIDAAARAPQTPDQALRSGVDVYGVIRYAAGVVSVDERTVIEAQLARSPWAMDRVVALVKGARTLGSIATTILDTARSGDWSGLLASGPDPEHHLALLLNTL